MIPSVKTLMARLVIFKSRAKNVRWIMEQASVDEIAKAYPHLERRGTLVHMAMNAIDDELDFFGVEYLCTPKQEIAALYVNTGETYDTTILYDVDKGRYVVTSYGDWVEREEKKGRLIV